MRFGCWVDSDFAGDLETRKSTTGYVFTLHGGAASWRSRLQRLEETSTTTAEYIAAAEGVKDSLWLRRILGAIREDARPVALYDDNQSCIAMADRVASSALTKHVDVCNHLVRDCVTRKQVILEYIASEEQVADGLTKPLPLEAFTHLRERIGVIEA